MERRSFLKTLGALLGASVVVPEAAKALPAPKPLLVQVDMGAGKTHYYKNGVPQDFDDLMITQAQLVYENDVSYERLISGQIRGPFPGRVTARLKVEAYLDEKTYPLLLGAFLEMEEFPIESKVLRSMGIADQNWVLTQVQHTERAQDLSMVYFEAVSTGPINMIEPTNEVTFPRVRPR